MSLWGCTCSHCRRWRAVVTISAGALGAAAKGIEVVDYIDRVLDSVPSDIAALLVDVSEAAEKQAPAPIATLLQELGIACDGETKNGES